MLGGLQGVVLSLVLGAVVAVDQPANDRANDLELRVTNLVPHFLSFHEETVAWEEMLREKRAAAEEEGDRVEELSPEALARERRSLWDDHLGDLAPLLRRGGQGRWEPRGLEEAWTRYSREMSRLQQAASQGLATDPAPILHEVGAALRLDQPLSVELILYVGTFQESPAFRLDGGEYAILLPMEEDPAPLTPVLSDLFTRAVHARLSGRPSEGRLSVAQHLFLRGLALRVHEAIRPGRSAEEYLLRPRSWLLSAEQRDGAVLDRYRGALTEREPETVAPLLEGEFDYAAWRVSGLLLMDGWTLERLARVPEGEVDGLVSGILGMN